MGKRDKKRNSSIINNYMDLNGIELEIERQSCIQSISTS